MILKVCMQHRALEYYQICSNYDPWLTLIYITARSILVPYAFVWEKVKTMDFSECIEVCDVKVVRCSQLNEYMKLYEYRRSRSLTDLGLRFNIFKLLFLNNHLAAWSQISCGASLGWGNEILFKWSRWQRWPPCPYMVKIIEYIFLWNRKADGLETWHIAGVVPCGGRKTSPRTSTIVQFIFYFGPLRSAIMFWEIRNKWLV